MNMHKKNKPTYTTTTKRKFNPSHTTMDRGMCCSFGANVTRKISMDLEASPLIPYSLFYYDFVLSAALVAAR